MILHHYEWGDAGGRAVVCVHGATGHGLLFRRLAEQEELSEVRAVAVDLRGRGHSGWDPPWDLETQVADLIETANALGIAPASWAGHSFGARVLVELAARAPELVEAAVLLEPVLHIEPSVGAQVAESLRADDSFETRNDAVAALVADGLVRTAPEDVVDEHAQRHLARGDDGRLRWRYSPCAVITSYSDLCKPPPPWPKCPTLVVAARESGVTVDVPAASNIERARVPGGHVVLWDAYEQTASAMADFLARQDRA